MRFLGAFYRDLLSGALCSPIQGGAARAARTLRFRVRVLGRDCGAWGCIGHALCSCPTQRPVENPRVRPHPARTRRFPGLVGSAQSFGQLVSAPIRPVGTTTGQSTSDPAPPRVRHLDRKLHRKYHRNQIDSGKRLLVEYGAGSGGRGGLV